MRSKPFKTLSLVTNRCYLLPQQIWSIPLIKRPIVLWTTQVLFKCFFMYFCKKKKKFKPNSREKKENKKMFDNSTLSLTLICTIANISMFIFNNYHKGIFICKRVLFSY